tara:strand:- start:1425 stop:2621 length:1197 start_codon:yes stop_codon:yes gene_type:complete
MAEITYVNTGRARVIVRIEDDSQIALIGEGSTPHTSVYLTTDGGGIINKLGNTAEREQGFIEEQTVNGWITRLRGGFGTDGASYASPEAVNENFTRDWYSVQNYLLYGGNVIVGATASKLQHQNIDSAFTSIVGDATDELTTLLTNRGGDFIAIYPAGGSAENNVNVDLAAPGEGVNVENKVHVFGYKKHLNYQRSGIINDTSELITTSCAADVAGCLARTDRDFAPYYSPAGFVRGRILDVVRLVKNLTESEQDTLYEANVNPIVTFQGQGTFLFGDKTMKDESSSLSRINVSRLFIFLKKRIGDIAKRKLFEFNDSDTRESFRVSAETILRGVAANRGIFDFRVVCDETNNTPEAVDAGIFVADVFVKPTKSVNFVQLTFTNANTADDISGGLSEV